MGVDTATTELEQRQGRKTTAVVSREMTPVVVVVVGLAGVAHGREKGILGGQAPLPHGRRRLQVLELEDGKRCKAVKNVTGNESFFQGHFPGAAVMPGVLIIEAMAQVAGVLIYRDLPNKEKKLIYFTGIENAKFRRPVVPGDQLRIEMEFLNRRNNFGKMQGRATVDGKLAAEAVVTFAVVEHPGT